AEREVETGEQRGPVLLRPAAPEDGRRKTEDGSAAFPALAFRLPPPAWWGDVLLPPAHDVQAQARDAEGAEQAEGIQIAKDRLRVRRERGRDQHEDRDAHGQQDGEMGRAAQAITSLNKLGKEAHA